MGRRMGTRQRVVNEGGVGSLYVGLVSVELLFK